MNGTNIQMQDKILTWKCKIDSNMQMQDTNIQMQDIEIQMQDINMQIQD